jgi:hypothetical protein
MACTQQKKSLEIKKVRKGESKERQRKRKKKGRGILIMLRDPSSIDCLNMMSFG